MCVSAGGEYSDFPIPLDDLEVSINGPPNQRARGNGALRRCAESESLDCIHGCSAPCLIPVVLQIGYVLLQVTGDMLTHRRLA